MFHKPMGYVIHIYTIFPLYILKTAIWFIVSTRNYVFQESTFKVLFVDAKLLSINCPRIYWWVFIYIGEYVFWVSTFD